MGYKRRARIVFLGGAHPAPAKLAAHYAHKLGSDWIEARAAVLPGVVGEVAELDSDLLAWADLLVTLDAAALAARPPLRRGLQHRHYPFEPIPPATDKAAWSALAVRVRERISGMIGGMQLLEKAAQADSLNDL